MYRLLSGLRIVEGASFIAGPSCGLHLAQIGAEVIRFDPIGGGPDYHRWPLSPDGGSSLYWEGLNKGKKSVVLDLSRAEGRELALAIATAPGEEGGLFLTNFPATGFLSHQALSDRRADMITVRIMGWADGAPGVDYTVNAATGVPMMTGPVDHVQPVNHVLPAWDLLGGAYAAFYLMSALVRRRATGEGAEIRLPLSDIAATALGHIGSVAEVVTAGDRERSGNDLYGAFGRDFVCADGVRLIVVAITPKQWRGVVQVLGLEEEVARLATAMGTDFANEGARFIHRDKLFPLFEARFASSGSGALEAEFDRRGVTWGRYQTLHAAVSEDRRLFVDNPQFQTVTHPSGLTYPAAGPAATLSGEARDDLAPAPCLGAHTDEVLATLLGLTGREIGRLRDQGLAA